MLWLCYMWEILEQTLSSRPMEGMLLCLREKVEVWDLFKVTPSLYSKFGYPSCAQWVRPGLLCYDQISATMLQICWIVLLEWWRFWSLVQLAISTIGANVTWRKELLKGSLATFFKKNLLVLLQNFQVLSCLVWNICLHNGHLWTMDCVTKINTSMM